MSFVYRAAAVVTLCLGLSLPAGPVAAQGALQGLPHPTAPQPTPDFGAHGRYSKVPINMAPPNLELTVALISAGGGVSAFDANKLVGNLTGNGPITQSEIATLTKKFGAANVTSFVRTFNFVATDALAQTAKAGIALPTTPTPDPSDPKALSGALYDAGLAPGGRYDVEYMLDTLVSHIVHVQVMNDIDANPDLGPAADANYHLVLTQVMQDLKKAYDLATPAPQPKS